MPPSEERLKGQVLRPANGFDATYCNTWNLVEAVHQPIPALQPSGSTSVLAHSSAGRFGPVIRPLQYTKV